MDGATPGPMSRNGEISDSVKNRFSGWSHNLELAEMHRPARVECQLRLTPSRGTIASVNALKVEPIS
jgi:hypothetical protein